MNITQKQALLCAVASVALVSAFDVQARQQVGTTNGAESIALGANSVANGDRASAVGDGATADGADSTAVGARARATTNGTALGSDTEATGSGSVSAISRLARTPVNLSSVTGTPRWAMGPALM